MQEIILKRNHFSSSKCAMYVVEAWGMLPRIKYGQGVRWEPGVGGRGGKRWMLTAVWVQGYMEQEFQDV